VTSRSSFALLAAIAVAACVDIEPTTGAWQAADAITGALAPELGPPPTPRLPPTGALRVASWNVHTGADTQALAAAIASSPLATADVILIQEIEAHPAESATRASRLAGALGMTWIYVPAWTEDAHTQGDAILSRYQLVDVRVMALPHVDQPINARDRIALGATVVIGERALPVVGVHLDTRIGPVDRIRQLSPAVRELPPETLVAGDFNTLPWSWVGTVVPLTGTEAVVGQSQAQVLDDYFAAQGFAAAIPREVPTYPFPVGIHLDGVYVRGVPVLDAGVATTADGSDHLPVWVDVP
jgi:endonuclease/exonuclease/phosphatase family metal-dependent hydrolase